MRLPIETTDANSQRRVRLRGVCPMRRGASEVLMDVRTRRRRAAGFSVVEAMVATSVMVIGLLAIASATTSTQLLRKRSTRARFEVATDASQEPGGRDPATGVTGLDLRAAFSRLDPDDRALLAMRFLAGFDSNELAAATGMSPSGTRSRIERLLKRLREDLRDG